MRKLLRLTLVLLLMPVLLGNAVISGLKQFAGGRINFVAPGGTDFTQDANALGCWLMFSDGLETGAEADRCGALTMAFTGTTFITTSPPIGTAAGQDAVQFDGSTTYFSRANVDSLEASDFTLGCWNREGSETGSDDGVVFTMGDQENWEVRNERHGNFRGEVSNTQSDSVADAKPGQWNHWAIRYDGTGTSPDAVDDDVELFYNGLIDCDGGCVAAGSDPAGNTDDLVIGADETKTTLWFSGDIMECFYADRVYSDLEMAEIFLTGYDGTANGQARDAAYPGARCVNFPGICDPIENIFIADAACQGAWALYSSGDETGATTDRCNSFDMTAAGDIDFTSATVPAGTSAGQDGMTLDGTDDDLFLASDTAFEALGFTIALWVLDPTDSGSQSIFSKGRVENWGLITFSSDKFRGYISNAHNTLDDINPFNVWHHISFRFDGDSSSSEVTDQSIEIFLNAVFNKEGAGLTDPSGNSDQLLIGAGDSSNYSGDIMEVIYLDRVLASAELEDMYLCGIDGKADGYLRDAAFNGPQCNVAGSCCAGGDLMAPRETLNDQFADDDTGWTEDNGFITNGCTFVTSETQCTSDGGNGNFRQTGDDDGTNPLTQDQYVVMEWGSSTNDFQGVGLRVTNAEPGDTDHNYTVRCDGSSQFQFRICDFGDVCFTFFTSTVTTCAGTTQGDRIALAVAGQGDNTELCAWFWPSADADEVYWDDILTWKDPQQCTANLSEMNLLYDLVGSGTAQAAWDCDPNDCDTGSKGYPDQGNKTIIIYDGAGQNMDVEWIRAGDLNVRGGVLLAEEDFETSPEACSAVPGMSSATGDTDCEYTTVALEGSQSARVFDTTTRGVLNFNAAFSVGSEAVVCDLLLHFETYADTVVEHALFHFNVGAVQLGARVQKLADETVEIYCEGGTPIGDFTPTVDTTYKVRIAYCETAAGCDALGITDAGSDGDAGEIWWDTTGDYGDGGAGGSTCDNNNTFAGDIDGFRWIADTTDPNVEFVLDSHACCSYMPAPGEKCI